jgi:hypothetical protein
MNLLILTTIHSLLHPTILTVDTNAYNISRCLEVYLLWLFGCIMFNNSHVLSVDNVIVTYACAIANMEEDNIPVWS